MVGTEADPNPSTGFLNSKLQAPRKKDGGQANYK
jgi:hypothetical protein